MLHHRPPKISLRDRLPDEDDRCVAAGATVRGWHYALATMVAFALLAGSVAVS